MEHILILTNTEKYHYHASISKLITKLPCFASYQLSLLDTGSSQNSRDVIPQISSLSPAIIITLDLAGFQYRTQLGEIYLNMLPAKILNLVWGNKKEYATWLTKKLSLSMHFFDCSATPCPLADIYPNIAYYNAPGVILTDHGADIDTEQNQNLLLQIGRCFLSELQT